MTNSTNTLPPVDGIEELDEFLRDNRNSPETLQTDLEDFTGPTPRPAAAMKPRTQPNDVNRAVKDGNKKKGKKENEKANHTSREKKPLKVVQQDQSTTEVTGIKPETPPAVASAETGVVREAPATPNAVIQTAAAPRPLGVILSPAAVPPVHALGTQLATIATAAERVIQAPMAIILSTLLALLAVIAQGHVNVRLLHGSVKPVSLFLLTIGASGLRKTTVDDFVSQGAKWAEAAMLEEQEGDYTPVWQRIIRTGTYEGLLRILKDGAGSLALLNDDAGSFLGGNAMSAENRMKTTAGLSQMWDGSPVNHVLADQVRSINMSHRRLSAHLGIQPELMLPLLADASFFNQGILARFLVSVPGSNIGYRPFRRPEKNDQKIIKNFAGTVRTLVKASLSYRSEKSRALKLRTLELSEDASDIFVSYADEVELCQRPFGPYANLTGPASKFAENAIRIAGVLAYFEDQTATSISANQAHSAVELMRFYATEMVRLTSIQQHSALLGPAQKVLNWLHKRWNHPTIRFQDFYQGGPFRTADDARPIIPVLEQHGWLVRLSGNGYVGATDTWTVIPRPIVNVMTTAPSSNTTP